MTSVQRNYDVNSLEGSPAHYSLSVPRQDPKSDGDCSEEDRINAEDLMEWSGLTSIWSWNIHNQLSPGAGNGNCSH